MLDSRRGAEDATSEVFPQAAALIESYDGSIPFPGGCCGWLATNALTLCGADSVDGRLIVEVEDGAAVHRDRRFGAVAAGCCPQHGESVQVRDAIARLPENYRVPLVLRYYGELSYDEIAQQLGLQRNYVAGIDISSQAGSCAGNWPTGASDHGMLFGTDRRHIRGTANWRWRARRLREIWPRAGAAATVGRITR